ncbi:hypothetical protein GCM10008931_43590 [Oceanobacillus oncorhynchi subsp. oncorhynchi]|uniref:hypothetical protein n=1 Tax=Oceanobacillus oncorhynchi TaxID=545501 RepID=UPI0031E3D0C7
MTNHTSFKELVIDEFVKLTLRLHYSGYKNIYSGDYGTYNKMIDEIRNKYLFELMQNNPDWTHEEKREMDKEINDRIRDKTSLQLKD